MNAPSQLPDYNGYGVTHARVDERGIHFESELAVQLADGTLAMRSMPTGLNEQAAIRRLLCGHR